MTKKAPPQAPAARAVTNTLAMYFIPSFARGATAQPISDLATAIAQLKISDDVTEIKIERKFVVLTKDAREGEVSHTIVAFGPVMKRYDTYKHVDLRA